MFLRHSLSAQLVTLTRYRICNLETCSWSFILKFKKPGMYKQSFGFFMNQIKYCQKAVYYAIRIGGIFILWLI